jgi:hypothetical protein
VSRDEIQEGLHVERPPTAVVSGNTGSLEDLRDVGKRGHDQRREKRHRACRDVARDEDRLHRWRSSAESEVVFRPLDRRCDMAVSRRFDAQIEPAFGECCFDPRIAEEVRTFCADGAANDLQGLLRRAFGPYHNRADDRDRQENGHHNADRSSHSIAPMSEPWGNKY